MWIDPPLSYHTKIARISREIARILRGQLPISAHPLSPRTPMGVAQVMLPPLYTIRNLLMTWTGRIDISLLWNHQKTFSNWTIPILIRCPTLKKLDYNKRRQFQEKNKGLTSILVEKNSMICWMLTKHRNSQYLTQTRMNLLYKHLKFGIGDKR